MPFNRPALSDLIERTKADVSVRLLDGASVLRRTLLFVIARVLAGAIHLVYGYLDWIAQQAMPDTAESDALRRWAAFWGVDAKEATYAQQTFTFTGTNGVLIPQGTELQLPDGTLYTTDADAVVASGAVTFSATAVDSGAAGNADPGTTVTLSQPIAGLGSTGAVAGALVVAADAETDDDLRARLLEHVQTPPNGGSSNDYVEWALEVAGVTRAWPTPNAFGAGTVGLTFVMDDQVGSIFPSPTSVAAVQSYIDSVRPVTARVTVYAPVAAPLNFTISGISDPTVQAAVQAELDDLILRESIPGGTLLLSHINEAISNAVGETDHVLVSPSANVTAAAGTMTTRGSITWQ